LLMLHYTDTWNINSYVLLGMCPRHDMFLCHN